jgi:hypothetical protein
MRTKKKNNWTLDYGPVISCIFFRLLRLSLSDAYCEVILMTLIQTHFSQDPTRTSKFKSTYFMKKSYASDLDFVAKVAGFEIIPSRGNSY